MQTNSRNALKLFGHALFENGKAADAVVIFEALEEIDPGDIYPAKMLSLLYLMVGRLEDGVNKARSCLEMSSVAEDRRMLHFVMATAYRGLGDEKNAALAVQNYLTARS